MPNNTLSLEQKNDQNSYLERVLPPSSAVHRKNKINLLDHYRFSDFVNTQFNDDPVKLLQMMEKVRVAIQFNLGLSAIERDQHETNHPLWIKKGKPNFPITEACTLRPGSILYDATLPDEKKPTRVILVNSSPSDGEGFSILYQTKFRRFELYVEADGTVHSSLILNWEKIYDDLAPCTSDEPQPLRSFTPWQRHSESNFFNGRSTERILSYLSNTYPEVFSYNKTAYYQDQPSEVIHATRANVANMTTDSANIYLTFDETLITPPANIDTKQPILAVIKRHSPLLGNIFQVAPAIYEDGKLHLVFQGHQHLTEIVSVLSCDFNKEAIQHWKLKDNIYVKSSKPKQPTVWQNLHLLKHHENKEWVDKTSAGPMVRGSDVVMRDYWVGGFDIPVVYTEMVTIADIFNIENDTALSPQARLENFYYSDGGTTSFRRFTLSENELRDAKNVAVQVVLPHETPHAKFFWGENGENIARTTKMIADILFKMIPSTYHYKLRFAINMCCPAAAIERMGAGFGLRNKPEYISYITKAIKAEYPQLKIEVKTLMLSNADDFAEKHDKQKTEPINSAARHDTSSENNIALAEMLSDTEVSRLVWQGKPRNKEIYDMPKTLDITQKAKVRADFNFGYSGMIAALKDKDLRRIGYQEDGQPHSSVQGVLQCLKDNNNGLCAEKFEVMLGRVLLGSAWLLLGRYASDEEILLTTLLQSFLLREFCTGTGSSGIDIMQIYLLYNIRHLSNENLRNQLMATLFDIRSATQMVDYLYKSYLSTQINPDKDEASILKPSIIKLKTAIDLASGGQCQTYTEREKALVEVPTNKAKLHTPQVVKTLKPKNYTHHLIRYGLYATLAIVGSKYLLSTTGPKIKP